jgi:repressor LexA
MNQGELGRLLGVQKAAVSKYETEFVSPPAEVLLKLSKIFDVPVDYLLGADKMPKPNIKLPVLGMVHAGSPMLAVEEASDFIEVEPSAVSGTCFFMEVEGDCMMGDGILEGSLVLVRKQPRVENGQIAVIRLEDDVVLRRVRYAGKTLMLIPSNPKYEPMLVSSGDVEIIGRVIEVRIRNL